MAADERKEYLRDYRVAHHAEHLAYCHARYAARHDEYLAYAKEYRNEHQDELAVKRREYWLEHPEYGSNYKKSHPEKVRTYTNRWRRKRPDRVAGWNSHRRTLGFVTLNNPFAGGVGHHIDRERVVYIPEKLHRSISHNVWTGKNMEKINKLALEFAQMEVLQ